MKKIVYLVAGLLAWTVLFKYEQTSARNVFERSIHISPDWFLRYVGGFLILMLGIVLGTLCKTLLSTSEAGTELIDIKHVLRQTWHRTDLWLSVFGAPLLYGGLLRAGSSLEIGPFSYFAFQTGFSSYLAIRSLFHTTSNSAGA
jgi:hypothetical protein